MKKCDRRKNYVSETPSKGLKIILENNKEDNIEDCDCDCDCDFGCFNDGVDEIEMGIAFEVLVKKYAEALEQIKDLEAMLLSIDDD